LGRDFISIKILNPARAVMSTVAARAAAFGSWFPSWAVYLAAGFVCVSPAKPQALVEVQEAQPALGPALQQGPPAMAGRGKDSCRFTGRRR